MYLARDLSVTAVSCAVLVCPLDGVFGTEVPLGGSWVGAPFPNLLPCLPVSMCTQLYRRRNCEFLYSVPRWYLVWKFRVVRCPAGTSVHFRH
jgi:hypothetical protein